MQAYRVTKARELRGELMASAGTIVYDAVGHDYGLASDDTRATGIEHISVTLNSDGSTPTFTIPVTDLAAVTVEQAQEALEDQEGSPAPVCETKAAAFKRLGKARIGKALKAIELLGNLANRSTYEYTDAQVEKMKDALIKQIAASFGRFENKKADEGFEFDE
jgi:hypothetical protein